MAADPVFVDTNVLVYVSRPTAPEHAVARTVLGRLEADGCPIWISQQVMREYSPSSPGHRRPLRLFRWRPQLRTSSGQASFEMAVDSPAVLKRLLKLLATHPSTGKQVHYANIVATMQVHDVHRLLSFNTGDFRRFAGIVDLEPLPPI